MPVCLVLLIGIVWRMVEKQKINAVVFTVWVNQKCSIVYCLPPSCYSEGYSFWTGSLKCSRPHNWGKDLVFKIDNKLDKHWKQLKQFFSTFEVWICKTIIIHNPILGNLSMLFCSLIYGLSHLALDWPFALKKYCFKLICHVECYIYATLKCCVCVFVLLNSHFFFYVMLSFLIWTDVNIYKNWRLWMFVLVSSIDWFPNCYHAVYKK